MSNNITIHNSADYAGMRNAGKLAASIIDYIADYVKPGVTSAELDKLCHDKIIAHQAIPSPLNYRGFPISICTSVNHVVCHGIPSSKKLYNGDKINIDVTVILDGWHGDTSRMFFVGEPSIKAKRHCLRWVVASCMTMARCILVIVDHLAPCASVVKAMT